MQAAFQATTDAGISKTINFPNSATVEDVENAYMLAWRERCKGITVYRAGSREKEVLTTGHEDSKSTEEAATENGQMAIPQYVIERERPAKLSGTTRRVRTGRGNVYVTVNMSEDGRPFEVFAAHGKAGGNDAAMAEAVSRMVSLSLRSAVDPKDVVTQLRGITDMPAWDQGQLIRSVPDAIALVLDEVIAESESMRTPLPDDAGQLTMLEQPTSRELGMPSAQPVDFISAPARDMAAILNSSMCPDCQAPLAHEEGCVKCYLCGFSQC